MHSAPESAVLVDLGRLALGWFQHLLESRVAIALQATAKALQEVARPFRRPVGRVVKRHQAPGDESPHVPALHAVHMVAVEHLEPGVVGL